ncbi:NTP transferase domain-containing protein [Pseudomonas sp. PDM14]|uniref:sugar phosphate nucleotidyltransferase n=1 Tax=Pseudomonas sp. PDM14 TaxID=2769288 RepID=UPI0017876438|nr:sugar phosphate nucleotidyltransferase [Pseudomonas sp. PDM14]MBD9484378.1 NTP transferase domain-containing protein [Pseudomonas sp. PDM14]
MRAYVLCGGLGTRLRSVTDSQKALVQVHGEPFLARVLRQLKQAGIADVVLCAYYRAEQLAEQLTALSRDCGLPLDMVVDPELLGTGGALLNALHERPPQGRYLVLNADTFLDADAYRMAAASEGNALVAVRIADRSRYGSLEVGEQSILIALREKGLEGEGLINAGVYAFVSTAFEVIAPTPCSLERDLIPELLERQPVVVIDYAGRFIDIGTPESLARYVNDFQADQLR